MKTGVGVAEEVIERNDDGFSIPVARKGDTMSIGRHPTLTQRIEGRTIGVVGDIHRFLAVGDDTNGRYARWEATVPPGGGPPPHIHSREDEGFYIVDGEITFQVGEKRFVATAGAFASMPVGTLHCFKNESAQPAKMIITIAPASLEQMFFEVGHALAPDATAASPPAKAEIEKLLAVAPPYGIEIKLPEE